MDLLTRINDSVGFPHHAGRHPLSPLAPGTYKCQHSRILKGVCFDCGEALTEGSDSRLSFDYLLPGLRLGVGEVARLKNNNSGYLVVKKKLHLVLDLDHTLIHAKPFAKLTAREQTLKSRAVSVEGHLSSEGGCGKDDLYKLESGFLVKLRPFVRRFLEEASSMYEIWVCTKGNRYYAQQILNILKDNNFLGKDRVIAREDLMDGKKKSLDLVLGRENCTVIVDDSKEVWDDDNITNLIEIGKYHYFKNKTKKKDIEEKEESYFEKETDESEEDGALSNVLRVLQKLHGLVFDEDDDDGDGPDAAWVCKHRDVRRLLKKIKSEVVLKGCNLGFTHDDDFEEILEAIDEVEDGYSTVVDSTTTTTSSKRKSEECLWADQNRKRSKWGS